MAPFGHPSDPRRLRATDAKRLARAPDGPRQQVAWDLGVQGLGLRLYPKRKSWVLRVIHKGGKRSMQTIGRADGPKPMSLDDAREKAKIITGRAKSSGDKPASTMTVDALLAHYGEHHRTRKKGRAPKDDRDFRRRAQLLRDAWGRRRIDRVTNQVLADFLRDYEAERKRATGKVPTYESNRIRQLVSGVWNHARAWHFLPPTWANPVGGTRAHRERVRPNAAPRDSALAEIIDVATESSTVDVVVMVQLLATVGARISELHSRTWEDIDLVHGMLTIRDPKNARDHHVPLDEYCVQLLGRLPRYPGNPYVFAGARGGPRSLRRITRDICAVFKLAGYPDMQVKDLRAAAATAIARELHPKAAQQLLNHADIRTTMRYIRPDGDDLRAVVAARAKQVRKASRD